MTASTPADGVRAVLLDAAEVIENLDPYRRQAYESREGIGGVVFQQVFESARRVHAGAALLHLERHLGIPQIQHWTEASAKGAVHALREAAGAEPAPGLVECAALRSLTAFHSALAAAIGSDEVQTGALVGAVLRRIERLEGDLDRARRQIEDLRTHRAPAPADQAASKPVVTARVPLFEMEVSDV